MFRLKKPIPAFYAGSDRQREEKENRQSEESLKSLLCFVAGVQRVSHRLVELRTFPATLSKHPVTFTGTMRVPLSALTGRGAQPPCEATRQLTEQGIAKRRHFTKAGSLIKTFFEHCC